MRIHHDKHHNTYVNNLNSTLENYPDLQDRSIEELIADLDSIPQEIRRAIRNNGGQHSNHTMFWEIMSPNGGGEPTGQLASAIDASFGSFENMQEQWSAM